MPATYPKSGSVALIYDSIEFKSGTKIVRNGSVNPSLVATAGLPGDYYTPAGSAITYVKQDSGTTTNWANANSGIAVANDTNWVAETGLVFSAGFGTTTAVDIKARQEGEDLLIRGCFKLGTAAASTAFITLPAKWRIKTLATPTTVALTSMLGYYQRGNGAIAVYGNGSGVLMWDGTDTATMYFSRGFNAGSGQIFDKFNVNSFGSAGEYWYLDLRIPIQGFTAVTNYTALSASQFSTKTNSLTFKSTAIVIGDAVGTFNTYTYASGSNTATIAATAPTQTTADMLVNGVLITGRAYNATSTAGAPTRVDIKVGTGLSGDEIYAYVNTGYTNGIYPFVKPGNAALTTLTGVEKSYDPTTGILTVNAGLDVTTLSTTRNVGTRTDTGVAIGSAYFVINAGTQAALAGFQSISKGGLITGNASSVASVLPVGTDGYIPYADASQALGIRWDVAPTSGGGTALSNTGLLNLDLKGIADNAVLGDFTTFEAATWGTAPTAFSGAFSISSTVSEQIGGAKVFKYVPAAGVSDRIVRTISIPVGFRGRLMDLSFMTNYPTRTSTFPNMLIYDVTNANAICDYGTTNSNESMFNRTATDRGSNYTTSQMTFFIPSNCTQIQYSPALYVGGNTLWNNVVLKPSKIVYSTRSWPLSFVTVAPTTIGQFSTVRLDATNSIIRNTVAPSQTSASMIVDGIYCTGRTAGSAAGANGTVNGIEVYVGKNIKNIKVTAYADNALMRENGINYDSRGTLPRFNYRYNRLTGIFYYNEDGSQTLTNTYALLECFENDV